METRETLPQTLRDRDRRPEAAGLRSLLAWYARAKRTMPWRGHPDPYAVWVSEIMLQQTRVETVVPYFDRFMERFPSVGDLAAADLQEVLGLWQGLGYYSRARNLHRAAGQVCSVWGGTVPRNASSLRELPGIGRYTAAAIASICFGEREPVIDGNVLRVVARVLRLAEDIRRPGALRAVDAWLRPLIAAAPIPGDFNQAMMELGALVCLPRNPACAGCPFRRICQACRVGDVLSFPVQAPAKAVPTRTGVGLILWKDGCILLARRAGERFLGELWELPGGYCEPDETPEAALTRTVALQAGVNLKAPVWLGRVKQVYSHFKLDLQVFTARVRVGTLPHGSSDRLRWVRPADVESLPLSNAPKAALNRFLAASSFRSSIG